MFCFLKSSHTTFYKQRSNNFVYTQRIRKFFNNLYFIIFP